MSLNVCLLVLDCYFSKNLQPPPMAKSINMVWGAHIARVKTKNILNLRIGLFEKPLSYVELIVLRTNYLLGPPFCAPPPPGWGVQGALVSALERWLQFFCWVEVVNCAQYCFYAVVNCVKILQKIKLIQDFPC